MDDRVVIALFRHGLTEENNRKAYLGWNDSPLTSEANALYTTKRYDGYFSSDLPRCLATAEILFSNMKVHPLVNLREMNFGIWEGKTYENLKDDSQYQRWLSNPSRYCPPKGESFYDFTSRVQSGWEQVIHHILSQNLHSSAVVTHGGVIRHFLTTYAPEKKDFWDWQVSHHLGFELIFERDALRSGDRCTLLQEVPLTAKEDGSRKHTGS